MIDALRRLDSDTSHVIRTITNQISATKGRLPITLTIPIGKWLTSALRSLTKVYKYFFPFLSPFSLYFYFLLKDRRRQPTSSNQPRVAIPSDAESGSNVRFASPIRRESFDRFSNSSDQLKNQRPWSYISPEDLPSSPNKLNQFYNSRFIHQPVKTFNDL